MRAALEQFSAHGFESSSMDDIAAGASVTKPIIYRHFHSKRSLYLELLDYVGASLTAAIQEATSNIESPHERLRAGVYAFFRFVSEHRSAYLILFDPRGQRDREFQEVLDRIQLRIASLVASRVTGVSDESYKIFISFALIGLAQGAARSFLIDSEKSGQASPIRKLAEERAYETAELLWSGMRNIPSQPGCDPALDGS